MVVDLTADDVAGLAPDDASLKAARGLAVERRWSDLGRSDRALWGLCRGSGSKPYQTQVDATGPAYRCSCPSRKVPCKHALGLLLLAAEEPGALLEAGPPEWVGEWLRSRDERAQRAEAGAAKKKDTRAPDPKVRARRQAQREERVRAGVEEFERWLHDLARQGLAQGAQRPFGFWDEAAARLVDAQAPALAGRLRMFGSLVAAGGDTWAEALLEEVGLVQLLLSAHRRLDALPGDLQADVRTLIGWTVSQEDVLGRAQVRDRWAVLGRVIDEQDLLRVQRLWLHGAESGLPALVLSFAHAGAPLDAGLPAGTSVDASLCFYESAAPLRALVAEQHAPPEPLTEFPGRSISAALAARAETLGRQPWQWRLPVCLAEVVPIEHEGTWLAAEPDGRAVALVCDHLAGWRMVALAGGRPFALFGEWVRERVRPLSVFVEERVVSL